MLDAPERQSATFEIRPSDTMVGAEVLGLDLSKPLDEAAFEKVSAAFDSFSVVCFRDQVLTQSSTSRSRVVSVPCKSMSVVSSTSPAIQKSISFRMCWSTASRSAHKTPAGIGTPISVICRSPPEPLSFTLWKCRSATASRLATRCLQVPGRPMKTCHPR